MQILSLIKVALDFIMAIPGWIIALVNHSVQADVNRRKSAIKDAVKKAKEAQTIEEKADAACEIEKALDPSSNCDSKPWS